MDERDGRGPDGSDGGVADPRRALGAFLRVRRGRVAPQNVGIAGGARRRVRGLRREELAQLAGISVDYYVRLEQGRATQPSPEVVDALARALRLDATERDHLVTLATTRRGTAPEARVSPLLQRVLDGMAGLPAFVTNHRLDVVAWNRLGAALMGGLDDPARRDRNTARFLFLDPASRALFARWETAASEAVAQLRFHAGRYPYDAALTGLIADLAGRSADFRRLWEEGEVLSCGAGRKELRHPAAGVLPLDYETLRVPAVTGDTALEIHVYSPAEGEPGAAAALERLAASLPEPLAAGRAGR